MGQALVHMPFELDHPDHGTDKHLIERYRETGKEEYFEPIFFRHWPMVFRTAQFFVRNQTDAEDVTQQTFLNAIKHIRYGKYEDQNLAGWLRTIAVRLCFDELRRRGRCFQVTFGEAEKLLAAREVGGPEGAVDVKIALAKLPRIERIVLLMLLTYGLSYQEIADYVGMELNEVNATITRARRRFKKHCQLNTKAPRA